MVIDELYAFLEQRENLGFRECSRNSVLDSKNTSR